MKRVLSTREENVVNALRADGYTIKAVAQMFGVSKDVVINADPVRRAYITGYNKAMATFKKRSK